MLFNFAPGQKWTVLYTCIDSAVFTEQKKLNPVSVRLPVFKPEANKDVDRTLIL